MATDTVPADLVCPLYGIAEFSIRSLSKKLVRQNKTAYHLIGIQALRMFYD